MNLKDVIFGNSAAAVHDLGGSYSGSSQEWLPIKDILKGVIITRDKRFVKVLELLPVNFYTLSETEQGNAIADFAAYLKVAPDQLQINVLTQKFNLNGYLKLMKNRLDCEQNESCREMILESMQYVPQLVEREAITHRFFLTFSYEPGMKAANNSPGAIAARLNEQAEVARRYLDRCGISVLEPEYVDNFVLELFYELVNKHTSQHIRLPEGAYDMLGTIHGIYDESVVGTALEQKPENPGVKKKKWFMPKKKSAELPGLEGGATTIPDLIAPTSIDTHSPHFLLVDGVYHTYLYIAGYGYATVVGKGWLTPLIEAGEGVSVSFQLRKQPREKILSSISQTTMINRSRMRDVGDTRQDYEELDSAISSGLYLKDVMNRQGENFYYMHTLIEVTASDPETLEQRVTEVEKLCVSVDMIARRCNYKNEQTFLSALTILALDPDIERKARRNALTSGVAAAFPFVSYELSDHDGIFLGLNLYNRSPVFLNPYDDYKYTSGNWWIGGSTGAGKTVTLQCLGGRLREQGKRVIIIVPKKGHEFRPLCERLGGLYLRMSPSSKDCPNLMAIRRKSLDSYAKLKNIAARDDSVLADKIAQLIIWFSLKKKDLSEEDKSRLDSSLVEVYKRYGITFDNSTIVDENGNFRTMPILSDWYEILYQEQDTRHLAVVLSRYVTGSAAAMAGRNDIELNNKYIVLDLSGMPDDMIADGTFWATSIAYDLIMNCEDELSALLADELWSLVGATANPQAAGFVLEMVKTIRGLGGIAVTSTQGMQDLFSLEGGSYGKGILDSSRIKLVMQMEEQEARLIQDKLNLSEDEVRQITRFRRGEGLLCIGYNHVPIAFHTTPKEYEAITTSPTDLRVKRTGQIDE